MVPDGIQSALFCMSGLPQVQKSANVLPKGAIFKKECKKVLFNSFVIMLFSKLDHLFFPEEKHIICLKIKCAVFYELLILTI